MTFNAILANPFQFISTLIGMFDGLRLPKDFVELAKQDWADIEFDCMHILKMSSNASSACGRSSFNSFGAYAGR